MKKYILPAVFLIYSIPLFSMEFEPQIEIDKINMLETKEEIHTKLLKLKKDNRAFIKFLMKDKSYRPDEFNYSNILGLLLEKIPSDLSLMPPCRQLVENMISDYRVKWEFLEPPTHHIWKSFDKICTK